MYVLLQEENFDGYENHAFASDGSVSVTEPVLQTSPTSSPTGLYPSLSSFPVDSTDRCSSGKISFIFFHHNFLFNQIYIKTKKT